MLSVGIARVALNVHYPSDVLAGWSLGISAIFCLCLVGAFGRELPNRHRFSSDNGAVT